jgi:hypothetical protein
VATAAGAAHTYRRPGAYTVGVTVADDDLGTGQSTGQLVVLTPASATRAIAARLIDRAPNDLKVQMAVRRLVGVDGTGGAAARLDAGRSAPAMAELGLAWTLLDHAGVDASAEQRLLVQVANAIAIEAIDGRRDALCGPADRCTPSQRHALDELDRIVTGNGGGFHAIVRDTLVLVLVQLIR